MAKDWMKTLGLCLRAGCLVSGEDMVLDAVRHRKAHLVIVATDASERTRKRFTDKCHTYQTALVYAGETKELGAALGKDRRAVCAVLDEGFAGAIRERMEQWQRSE